MSATAGQAADQRDLAERLGIKPGHVVQEIGYDDDCDEQLRDSVAAGEDVELVDEDYDDVVDGVLLWWRDGEETSSTRLSMRRRRSPTAGTSCC